MKKIMGFLLVGLLALVVAGCSSSSNNDGSSGDSGSSDSGTSTDKIVMKIGISQTEDSPRMTGAREIKKYVEEKSNGRMEVQIYPNSQLGSSKEQVEGMQSGSIQMVIFPTTSVTDFNPIYTLPDIPYLLPTDQKKLLELYKTDAWKAFMESGNDAGIKSLATWFEGYSTLSTKAPIKNAADLKDLKLRIIGSDIAKDYYKDLGAPPSVVVFSEVYTALQTGRINALDIPPNQIFENKFYEVVKNITETNHFALSSLVMVNKDWYDSLPSDLQQILSDAAVKASPAELDYINQATDKDIQEMKDSGVNFYEPPEELVNALRQEQSKAEDQYVQLTGDKGKKILEDIKQAINDLQ